MAIYSIRELRDSAPKNLQGLSDEDLLREYSRINGERFEDNADYFGLKPKGTVGEMGRQLAGGAMVDLPKMVGQGLQYTGVAPQYGLEMQRAAEARAPEYEQDTRGDRTRGVVGQALVAGARGVAPALSIAPLALIPGVGEAAMVGAAGLLYGTSSAQETYQKLIDQGIPEEQAIAAARRVGVLQGGGEAIGSFVGGRAIRAAGPLLGLSGKTTAGLAGKLTDTAIAKPLAKAYATNLAVQPLTEVAQDVGTSLIERSYGAKEEDLGDIAKQSALGGAGLTAILGPLALGGHVSRSRRAEQLKQALYGQDTPTEIRAQATDMVINEARRQGISEKDVDSWFDSQLQLEDTRNAALARLEEERKRGERNLLVTEPDPIKDRIEQNLGLTRTSSAKDYAKTFEAAYSEPSGQRVQDPVTGLERELSVGEQFQRDTGGIDLTAPASTEVTAGIAKPAATVVRDPRAIELRDTFGVVPTPQALQLYGEIQQSGIPVDSDLLIDVWKFAGDKPMTLKRLERAQQLLDSALINARKGTPNVSVPNAPAAGITTGVGTGGTVLPGTLAPSGSTNAVPSTVGSNAGLVRAPAPSVSLLPDTGGEQSTGVISTPDTTDTIATAAPVVSAPDVAALTAAPSGPVVSRKRVVTVTPGMGQRAATAAPTDLNEAPVTGSRQQPLRSPEDRLAIARATGNAAELEAQAQEDAGTRIDSGDLSDEQVGKLIDTRFAKSKDKVRDAGILRAYLTVLRADRVKGSAEIVAAIAARYGIKPVSVRKIGNPSELVAAGKTLGLDSDQVLNLFGVDDNTKAQYTQIGQLQAEIKNLRNEYKLAQRPAEVQKAEIEKELTALNKARTALANSLEKTRSPELKAKYTEELAQLDADIADATARYKEAGTPEQKARIAKELSRTSEKIDRLEEEARVEQTRALSSALSDEGFKSEEGETAGFGMDTEREWSKVGEEGRAASKITAALEAEETLRATLAEFEAQGDQEAIAAINELIETERAKLEAALLEATPKEKGQVERAPKAKAGAVPLGSEVDYGDKKKLSPEAIKARDDARAKLEADRKGLQKGDTVTNPKLGTGVVQSFDGTGDATTVTVKFKSGQVKELSVKLAKLEKTNAIQEPSTTSVSVQPKAEVSQRVGGQVRRAEKPAGKSETKAPWEGVTSKTKGTVEVVNTSLLDGVDQRNKANTSTPEYAALKASIAETGIVDPITIVTTPAGKPEVFEGNHRLQIARELEIKKIPVVLHSLINRSESRPVAGIKPSSLFAKEIKTDTEQAAEAWDLVVAEYPEAPKFADLTAAQQKEFVGFGPDNWTADDVKTELVKLAKVSVKSTKALADESNIIDVESRIIDETIKPQVLALPAPAIQQLEKHYGVKSDTAEFLARVKADVILYATKGAEAVAGAIRSTIKAIHAGVLSVAMIFNPMQMAGNSELIIMAPKTVSQTVQVKADVPAQAKAKMSASAQQVYETLYPAIKDRLVSQDKFMVITDKQTANVFIFKPDGSLFLQKKVLVGRTVGDFYKGNTDKVENRITPAGLFTMGLRDAKRSEGEAHTAGGYDFGKVFVLDKAIDGEYSVTLFHSVWTKETDAKQRLAALDKEGAADSRYSFGCINVDKATFKSLTENNMAQMDGAALFIVPDKAELTGEFLTGATAQNKSGKDDLTRTTFTPQTKTTTSVVPNAKTTTVDRTQVGKEENVTTAQIRRLERGDTVEVKAEGLKFDGLITDVESLRRSPGVDAALRHYETNGMQSVIDGVETWMIAPDTVDFDAAIMMVDGKQTVAVRSGVLVDRTKSEWAIHHELGHIADNAFGENGIHSSQPEFNLQVKDNRIIARGAVAIEIAEYATNNPDSDFATTFKYPLDRSKNSKLTSDEIRLEMFAQLWAMFNTPGGNSFLEENLPKAFAFMEITDATTKQAESSTAAQAAARTPVKERGPQAPSNRGGSGLANPLQPNRPRFLNRPDQGLVQKTIAKLPPAVQQPVRNSLAALGDFGGKGLDKLVFTSDLVNRAVAGGLTSARNFADLISASKSEAREAERTVEKIADMYALVPEQDRGIGPSSFNQFLFDSTREAKWGYGKYRDDVMGDRFDALAPETQKLVKAIFEHGSTVLSQKKKVVIDSAVSEYDAMIKSAQDMGDKEAEGKLKGEKVSTLKRFDTLFKVRDGLPYAPIKRTGSHVVIAKSAEYADAEQRKDKVALAKLENDGDHYHVSFTDGKWDARTLQSQLQDQGFFESVDIAERDTVADELFGGASSLRELTKMRAKIEGNLQAGDKSASKLLSIVSQMYLEALAEGSARKSEMRRRGVAGELDMLQSFAQQGRADAQFMASVKYNPQVQDALQQMRNQAKTGDRARRSELLNELSKRYVQSMDYSPNPWLNKLTRMSSVYFLATSPAYYLQNLTQPWIMSVPAMAGRHDYTAASAALFKAYTELGPVMRSAKLLKQQFDFAQVPADVRNAIKTLADQGKIDIGLDSEIGEFRIEGQGAIREKFNAVDKALRLAVQKVESVNRLSTAMAAYRLEFAKTKDEAKATEYAGRILEETHGDYTSFNAPRAFNNPVGKVALQFRKFQLIQLAFHAKLIKDAFTNPSERAAALRTLGYSLAHTGVLAGAMGLPGYAALSWIIGAMFGDDDEDYNLTQEIRKAIGDEDISNMVLRGTPTLLGADISGKVGAGNMLSVLPFNNADITTRAGLFQTVGTLVGGASLGMTANMVDGLGLMLAGDWYKGIERTMPKGVGDAMKAYRIQTEGMTRRNGDVILPAEDISALDGLFQGLGIQPVKQAVVYERQQNIRDQDQKFQSRATQIKNEYVKAVKGRDTEAAAEARAAWAKLQATRVEKGYTRQPLSILLRAPQEQAKRERDTRGGVQFNKANKRAVTEEATL